MRVLYVLRGAPGTGKSTWIKNNFLEPYVISPDQLRMLAQSPEMQVDGKFQISVNNEKFTWETVEELMIKRMRRGDMTVIDATHSRASHINQYKKLCQKYRYRCIVVDFSHDVDEETVIRQNLARPGYKQVPESSVRQHLANLEAEPVPSWCKVIRPNQFRDHSSYRMEDLSHWKKIHHIGDIHGCYDTLMQYFAEGIQEDELYIFLGDYVDRGPQNGEVMKWILENYQRPNFIFLEGNHERHLWKWANNEQARSRIFNNETAPQIEELDKAEVRQFYRRLRQVVYYQYGDKQVVVTHGGLPVLKNGYDLMRIATASLIGGVGDYNTDIDEVWANLSAPNQYQLHGHRNVFRLLTEANARSYNLEGQIEMGGHLRAVTLTNEGFFVTEIKNDNFIRRTMERAPEVDEKKMNMKMLIDYMRHHKLVQEKVLKDNLSSFNFVREAFEAGAWDGISMKARGLFVNPQTEKIVARSYDKFFNLEEQKNTKLGHLAKTMTFPAYAYEKPNGYLAILGYDPDEDDFIFASKSTIHGQFAGWFKEFFLNWVEEDKQEALKEYMKENDVSLTFEMNLVEKDPHIIEYPVDHLVLLDIIKNDIVYQKAEYEEVLAWAHNLNIRCKVRYCIFENWVHFYKWYKSIKHNMDIKEEGFVIEDASGFMFKVKLPYYNFWKRMRAVKECIARGQEVNLATLYTPEHIQVYDWLRDKHPDFLRQHDIITLRKLYEKEMVACE